jgi:hypothetical protein
MQLVRVVEEYMSLRKSDDGKALVDLRISDETGVTVYVELTLRYKDFEEDGHPVSSLTCHEARDLADGLLKMADKADRLKKKLGMSLEDKPPKKRKANGFRSSPRYQLEK